MAAENRDSAIWGGESAEMARSLFRPTPAELEALRKKWKDTEANVCLQKTEDGFGEVCDGLDLSFLDAP